eukprot:TRINITY_DN6896_c0_g1_i3.p1 TRINITY_DN6896_c0_g1~~TRINITY_DN6896_c0_g1_i3.p1  ORF type:complete len:111 (-),score=7.41 TRINITY_DN6896_c0_g1_i3:89-421(-)
MLAASMTVPRYRPSWIGMAGLACYIAFLIFAIVWVFAVTIGFKYHMAAVMCMAIVGFLSSTIVAIELINLILPDKIFEIRMEEEVIEKEEPVPQTKHVHFQPSPGSIGAN